MAHLLSGAPRHINVSSVKKDLRDVPGVKHVHSVHIWSLTMSKTAIAAHLALGKTHSLTNSPTHSSLSLSLSPSLSLSLSLSLSEPGSDNQTVLNSASQMLKTDHHFAHTTLQVEDYERDMEDCRRCSDTPRNSRNVFAKILSKGKSNSDH